MFTIIVSFRSSNSVLSATKTDTALAVQHKPQGEEKFCSMTLHGISYTEKAAAGEMLLTISKEYPLSAPIEIGSYRGLKWRISTIRWVLITALTLRANKITRCN